MASTNVKITFEDEALDELRALTAALRDFEKFQFTINTIELNPNDVIVISAPEGVAVDREPFERLFRLNRVVILEHGATFEVIRS